MGKYKDILKISRASLKNRQKRLEKFFVPITSQIESINRTEFWVNTNNIEPPPIEIIDEYDSEAYKETLSDFETDEQENSMEEVKCFLKQWTFDHNITRTALTALLKFLKSNGFGYLPQDSRTFLKTPKCREVIDILPGRYSHIGVKASVDHFLDSQLVENSTLPSELFMDFNIDGVPISRSSQSSFWLILMKIIHKNIQKIYVVGIYHGFNKPNDFNEFLEPFVHEMEVLEQHYEYNSEPIILKTRFYTCDAPARASVTGTKGHTGYFGCGRCCQEGVYINHRMTFPETDSPLRTNDTFRAALDQNYHLTKSSLERLNIDMVEQFVLDYLHLVCLGVTKKLLHMWMSGDLAARLQSSDINAISEKLLSISLSQPCEFQRRIRGLKDIGNFKGTEFRTFVLYSGPYVLKDVLCKEKYEHFLLFHVAILICSDEILCKTYTDIAQQCLVSFIENFAEIYGAYHLVYNVHSLLHLVEDVKKFGALDNYSAFPFESYMYKVKNILHKNNQPLEQLCNRIAEINNSHLHESKHPIKSNSKLPVFKKKQRMNNTTPNSDFIYKQICFNNFKIDDSLKNKWFLTKNKEIVCFEFCTQNLNEMMIFGKQILNPRSFYVLPVDSINFDIFEVTLAVYSSSKWWKLDSISSKLFAMENNDNNINSFVFFPLRHSII